MFRSLCIFHTFTTSRVPARMEYPSTVQSSMASPLPPAGDLVRTGEMSRLLLLEHREGSRYLTCRLGSSPAAVSEILDMLR